MAEPVESCRKDKILDAAENAFAEHGFEGASMRQIVSEADVNLATVYYYFGSKEGLIEAVFKRRFGPLKAEQLERLHEFETAAQGQPLPVEKVLEAMIFPPLRLTAPGATNSQIAMRLIGRIVTDPKPQTQQLLRCQHSEVRSAFTAAFQRSLPELSARDLQWRLEFIWGTLAFVMCNPSRVAAVTDGLCDPQDLPTVLTQMNAFFSAGLRAPTTDFLNSEYQTACKKS